ncbi:uncharacterized protein LOC142790029 [Rhipicephalus microplus]|uniref:uncharacterized protein LOC142790029 n=1 Tax=Rhipicephalus microplus TaxID=6941 RepID=UPI003F6A74D9
MAAKHEEDDTDDVFGSGGGGSVGGDGSGRGVPFDVDPIIHDLPKTTETTTDSEAATSSPTQPKSTSSSPPTTVPTMPPATTLAPLITSTASQSTVTTPTVPTRTTEQEPMQPGSLLCTIGQGFQKTTYTFPPDGLCNIITFDSLYRKHASLAPPYPKDFEYFLETAKKARQSEFSIGIHRSIIANATAITEFLNDPSTKKYLHELWDDYRVYHYALVGEAHDFPGYHSIYVATVADALRVGTYFAAVEHFIVIAILCTLSTDFNLCHHVPYQFQISNFHRALYLPRNA